jgi:hypothetical protein
MSLPTRHAAPALGIIALASSLHAATPAFPGAEGFAALSTGGRGGDVYQVTHLGTKGPGSFSEAISTVPPEGRTIVFTVSGFIPINKAHIKSPKITIAGQTAPGGGIGITGSSLTISAADVIIRHVRFRHGHAGNGGDCLNPDGAADRLIIDHCDIMFSRDENISSFRAAPPTLTFQWSTNAWGLYGHSCGGLWLIDHANAHHTLWANHKTRNPKVIRPKLFDWTNNVTFGWDIGMNLAGSDVPGVYKANIRGSSFIQGSRGRNAIFVGDTKPDGPKSFHVHLDDCALDGNGIEAPDVTAEGYALIDGDHYHKVTRPFPLTARSDPRSPRDPVVGLPVKIDDRLTAYKKIISQVGPTRLDVRSELPLHDEVTALLIADVVAQKRRKISHEKELGLGNGGLGELVSSPAPNDTDRDGMPDFWETTLGLNPTAQDHNRPLRGRSFIPSPAGYTHLEEYLHFLAIPHGVLAPTETITIDLRKYTSGFTKSPRFKAHSVKGGSVTYSGPGDHRVTFSPHRGFHGRAGFDFTVLDADGSRWTQSCALLVTKRP